MINLSINWQYLLLYTHQMWSPILVLFGVNPPNAFLLPIGSHRSDLEMTLCNPLIIKICDSSKLGYFRTRKWSIWITVKCKSEGLSLPTLLKKFTSLQKLNAAFNLCFFNKICAYSCCQITLNSTVIVRTDMNSSHWWPLARKIIAWTSNS